MDKEDTATVELTETQIAWLRARVNDNRVVHDKGSSLVEFLAELDTRLKEGESRRIPGRS